MNPITAWVKKLVPAPILKALTLITNALLAGRQATGGAYDLQAGPQTTGNGNFKPQGFMKPITFGESPEDSIRAIGDSIEQRMSPDQLEAANRRVEALLSSSPTGTYTLAGVQQGFLSGAKGSIVKHELEEVLKKAATPEKVDLGPSHWQASLFTGASTIFLYAVHTVDWSRLFSAPKEFIPTFLTALVVGWGVYLQTPGRATVEVGTNHEVKKMAQTYSSVKVEAELPEVKE